MFKHAWVIPPCLGFAPLAVTLANTSPDTLVASVSAAVGSALTLLFTFLLNRQKAVNETQLRSMKIRAEAAETEQLHLFEESRKAREELRVEVQELKVQQKDALDKHTRCMAENMVLQRQIDDLKHESLLRDKRIQELEAVLSRLQPSSNNGSSH